MKLFLFLPRNGKELDLIRKKELALISPSTLIKKKKIIAKTDDSAINTAVMC